jgi:hypothetical protein
MSTLEVKSSIKAAILGFFTGVVLVPVAVLGLVVGLIEFLRPVLLPGVDALRTLPQGVLQSFTLPLLAVGVVLNGIIYGALLFGISLAHRNIAHKGIKVAIIAGVIMVFLAATGMIANLEKRGLSMDEHDDELETVAPNPQYWK